MLRWTSCFLGAALLPGMLLADLQIEAMADACADQMESSGEPYPEMCYLVRRNAIEKDVHYMPPVAYAHNHMTYELVAMYKLGANASVLSHCYERGGKGISPAIPSAHFISGANWREHIGDFSRGIAPTVSVHYADYLEFFRGKIQEHGVPATVQWAMPHLAEGLAGDLLHPLIQLGYCYEVPDTEICAEGLAWMATGFQQVGELNSSPTYTDIWQAMNDLHKEPRLPSAVTVPQLAASYPTTMADYDLLIPDHPTPEEVESAIKDISSAALDFFAVDGYQSFFVLHLSTGARAVQRILPHVDPMTQARILRRFWTTVLYFFVEYGRPEVHAPDVNEGSLRSWSALAAATIPHHDVHLAKMVYLARENRMEWGASAARFTLMAEKVVARFEAGNEWEFGGRVGPSPSTLVAFAQSSWPVGAVAVLLVAGSAGTFVHGRMTRRGQAELNRALLESE